MAVDRQRAMRVPASVLPDRIPRVLLHGVHVPDNNTPGDYDARTSQRPAGTTRAPCPASIWRAAASSILAQHTVVNVLDDARARQCPYASRRPRSCY